MTNPEPTRGVPPACGRNRWLLQSLLPITALFFWGCALCLSVGRIGFMPLDQSVVFDGAWRLLSGQVPFRDFTAPDGLTPIVLQVLFFEALGVTWFAYCLHAAVFNGLFCCLTYGLLRALASNRATALVYGALGGVVFYPPFGTPYREQHAFFFSLLAIMITVIARNRRRGWGTNLLWLLVPFVVTLGYFSKQIPTLFVVPLLTVYLLVRGRDRLLDALAWMGVGTILVSALLILSASGIRMDWELARVYFFALPGATGLERLEVLIEPRRILLNLMIRVGYTRWLDPEFAGFLVLGVFMLAWYAFISKRVRRSIKSGTLLVSLTTAVLLACGISGLLLDHRWSTALFLGPLGSGLILIAGGGMIIAFGPGSVIRDIRRCLDESFPAVVLAAGMSLMCLAVALLSWQASENSLALVFTGLGITQGCLIGLAGTVKSCMANSGMTSRIARGLVGILPWSLAVLAVIQAENFHRHVNVRRTVHQLENPGTPDLGGSIVSPALAFLVWDVPSPARYGLSPGEHAESVRETLKFLENQDGNFLLVGDSSILYALTHRPSVSPSLWFHPGLTIPSKGSVAFEQYQHRLLDNMDRYAVRFVVLEGERTWVDTRLSSFPALEEVVTRRRVGEYRFGHFTIIELGG